ncbi:MAG TPA: Ig-like domain-containing protein [Nocardioides sp.]|nr:Ig-like domain-containing protein [Nocardioides sp.]
MARTFRRVLTLVLGVGLLWVAAPSAAYAAFTAQTANTILIAAAADWNPPSVSLNSPGTSVKGTVPLTATASDAESGIQNVTIDYLASNGSWVAICTTAVAPYTCSWNTTGLADGSYDLRARAVDNAGYGTTSSTVRTTVANNLLVVLSSPGDVVRGSQSLQTTLYNTGGITYTVKVEYFQGDAGPWKVLCQSLSSPYTCSWPTTSFANDYYDLRATATNGTSSTTSAVVLDVQVDNLAPTVTMLDPGTPLSGTRTFEASAADTHSGVAQVVIQYAPTGTSTWSTLCTVATAPYSCRYDTTKLADGSYSFRAVATDVAGNSTTSTAVSNRLVDNTVSSVSVEDPGEYLSGAVTVTASASSTSGITSVRIQRALAGTTSWVDLCTDTTAPYSCLWDTTSVADGLYDLRAILTDSAGRTTISAVVAGRRVDNSPLRGYDIQTSNGGASAGKLEAGDVITFTFTEQVTLTSITSGWSGAAVPVTLRVRDGGLLGLTNKSDTLDILRNNVAVNLGSVNLREDYVKGGKTALFAATMTASTVTVNGTAATRVTLVAGALSSGGGLRTVSNPTAIVWTPSAAAQDLYSRPASTAPVTELGTLDREF